MELELVGVEDRRAFPQGVPLLYPPISGAELGVSDSIPLSAARPETSNKQQALQAGDATVRGSQ